MDSFLSTGYVDGKAAEEFPFNVTVDVFERGQERFDIYCSPCHGVTGDGNGQVVQRGFPTPPSLHETRLQQAPVGYLFSVITNGNGVMPSYASQIPVEDRWAIVAYVRALQLSQNASLENVPSNERSKLEANP